MICNYLEIPIYHSIQYKNAKSMQNNIYQNNFSLIISAMSQYRIRIINHTVMGYPYVPVFFPLSFLDL